MGNIFGKDFPEVKKKAKKRPGGSVGWNPSGGGNGCSGRNGSRGEGKLNPKDFILSGKQNEVLVREPGSIGGQQFVVEECSGCDIFLLDHTAALTIDVCTDCKIFTGPCESSVFIRDCKNCTLVLACQQFRARDCSGCTVFLFSGTQPVIESSVDLRFACYTLDYFSLAGQFAAARLSVWNNKWSEIYNFTGGHGDWSCLPPGSHHRDFAATKLPEAARQRVGYTDITNGAVVPLTAGIRDLIAEEESCFIVVMPGHVDAVLGKLLSVGGGGGSPTVGTSRLVRTKLFRPQTAQSKPFFKGTSAAMASIASSSPVLGMQWAGRGSADAAISLIEVSGITASKVPGESGKGKRKPGGIGTSEYYMADGSEESAAKAKVFFEQWEEDKGAVSLSHGSGN